MHKMQQKLLKNVSLKTHEKTHTGKNHSNAQSATRAFQHQVILENMRGPIQERNYLNVQSVEKASHNHLS